MSPWGSAPFTLNAKIRYILKFLTFNIFPILSSANTVLHLNSYGLAYTSDLCPLGVLCYKQWIQNSLLKNHRETNGNHSSNSLKLATPPFTPFSS